jgi:hypothetical protein
VGTAPGTAPLADLRPELDPTHLAVSRWPVGWRPPSLPSGFCALVVDVDEVTLVCSEDQLSEYDGAGREAVEVGWRRVTFAGPLPWEQVGFLADVAGRLAAAQIPFTSLSGFTTDHVLVRAAQADLAVSVLSGELPPEPRPGTTNP